ncbi:hypothetical protein QQF64_020398 [Cirrhinus molitorella]|uniref:Uncharacterized protein n=1 Tax=Cirrhinus molitorella TaxID=172907 RepID=A0ABR3LD02_9TELE
MIGMRDVGCGMWDAGCGMRDVGCGMRDAGCGMRDAGGHKETEESQLPCIPVTYPHPKNPTCYSFNEALSQTLLHYRAAQHATTRMSPAKLMLGRELELLLHRLCPPTSHDGNPVVEARVRKQQLKAQGKFDAKKKARIPKILPLDWVRVQQPHRKNKLHTFWSQPQQVQRQLGPVTFQLSDGSRWHASQLRNVLCPSDADLSQDSVLPCSLFVMPCAPSTAYSDSTSNIPTATWSIAKQAYQIT